MRAPSSRRVYHDPMSKRQPGKRPASKTPINTLAVSSDPKFLQNPAKVTVTGGEGQLASIETQRSELTYPRIPELDQQSNILV